MYNYNPQQQAQQAQRDAQTQKLAQQQFENYKQREAYQAAYNQSKK